MYEDSKDLEIEEVLEADYFEKKEKILNPRHGKFILLY
jgi:hypothetical protein